MRKSATALVIASSFLAGAIIGGGIFELHHHSAQVEDRALFTAKTRCQRIGQKYSAENSVTGGQIGLATVSVSVLKVDYSPALHSCIAETETRSSGLKSVNYEVQDIVTNGLYGGEICGDETDCDKRSGEIDAKLNELFARVMSGQAKLVGK